MKLFFSRHYLFLLLSIMFNVAANYTLKAYAASKQQSFYELLKNYSLYVAVAFFGINFLFYAKALQNINISLAYPIVVGLSVVMITIASMSFLHEKLHFVQVMGIVLILGGVVLLNVKLD